MTGVANSYELYPRKNEVRDGKSIIKIELVRIPVNERLFNETKE